MLQAADDRAEQEGGGFAVVLARCPLAFKMEPNGAQTNNSKGYNDTDLIDDIKTYRYAVVSCVMNQSSSNTDDSNFKD